MKAGQDVLIVDPFPETAEVLQTLLSRRGMHVHRSATSSDLDEKTAKSRPDLVVIDAETDAISFPNHHHWDDVPQIIIGKVETDESDHSHSNRHRCYLPKPFHYPELIQAVERLLTNSSADSND